MTPTVLFHIDIDSPLTLSRFWGLDEAEAAKSLDPFYQTAMSRALSLLAASGVKATFFCVGNELHQSAQAVRMLGQAVSSGHEIANHSFSHPYGFSNLSDEAMKGEIEACSNAIEQKLGVRPVGFRAPSYDMNTRGVNLLEKLGFSYDSSLFASSLSLAIAWYHRMRRQGNSDSGFSQNSLRAPRQPYYPDSQDFSKRGASRSILEIPMPRSRFLQMPFYNNFHLSAGELCRLQQINSMKEGVVAYLFHLIEFCDLKDDFCSGLGVHPNLRLSSQEKMRRIQDSIRLFKKRYSIMRTDAFVSQIKSARTPEKIA